ncbi:uncharacterized protein [Rutidosis leptorrhynchoides]|uniref:uncharacterized protein n=1 Tax=Rutidosis leptorrhynchoides TaxID=125765 RepID=UPI003A9A16B2
MTTEPIKLAAQPIHQIQHFVPFKLDLDTRKYNSCSELFKIHCKAHDVLDHLTSETLPSSAKGKETETITPELWNRHDAIVLQWMYATMSLDLMNTIMEPEITTKKTWDRLKSVFHDNMHSRSLALENQFVNTKLDDFPNMDAYCQQLKMIVDQLADVDAKVEPIDWFYN